MTQITRMDWLASQVGLKEGLKDDVRALQTVPFGTFLIAIALSIAAGALLNMGLTRIRRRRRLRRENQR